jgi:hypothetical protein
MRLGERQVRIGGTVNRLLTILAPDRRIKGMLNRA